MSHNARAADAAYIRKLEHARRRRRAYGAVGNEEGWPLNQSDHDNACRVCGYHVCAPNCGDGYPSKPAAERLAAKQRIRASVSCVYCDVENDEPCVTCAAPPKLCAVIGQRAPRAGCMCGACCDVRIAQVAAELAREEPAERAR